MSKKNSLTSTRIDMWRVVTSEDKITVLHVRADAKVEPSLSTITGSQEVVETLWSTSQKTVSLEQQLWVRIPFI